MQRIMPTAAHDSQHGLLKPTRDVSILGMSLFPLLYHRELKNLGRSRCHGKLPDGRVSQIFDFDSAYKGSMEVSVHVGTRQEKSVVCQVSKLGTSPHGPDGVCTLIAFSASSSRPSVSLLPVDIVWPSGNKTWPALITLGSQTRSITSTTHRMAGSGPRNL